MSDELVAFNVGPNTPEIRFLASLSDGRTVIQDDRPGEPHAWHRLKSFVEKTGLKITCLRIQGPNGRQISTPGNQLGYVFGRKMIAVYPAGQTDSVGVGFWDGEVGTVIWAALPDLLQTTAEQQDRDKLGFKLIENPK